MKDNILETINIYENVTFKQLVDIIGDDARGDYDIKQDDNVIFWSGVSKEFASAIAELKNDKIIHFDVCVDYVKRTGHPLAYLLDGGILNLPIIKTYDMMQNCTTPHWLPITVSTKPAI